jgi:inosose dehydratase
MTLRLGESPLASRETLLFESVSRKGRKDSPRRKSRRTVPIKIGTAPVSWGIMEVEGWGGQKDYREMLDEMAEAGYEGTELGPYGYLPADPERLISELSSRGLRLVSAFVPVALAEPERHESSFREAMKIAELLAKSATRLIVLADEMSEARMAVAGRVIEDRDGMGDPGWDSAVSILTRVALACRELGLATTFHHHAGTYIETPKEIERLCASTDPGLIGLCLDTGHYFYGGGDPVEAVQKYGRRIWHVHLKGIHPAVLDVVRQERANFLDAVRRGVFCELGDGAIDFRAIERGLLNCGYDGWCVVEQDVDTTQQDVQPLESATRSRRYLREVIGF